MNQNVVLKNTQFLKLLISQVTSLLAFSLANYVLSLKLYSETNSAYSVSILWIVYSLPVILVGPFASTIVDMANRKKILIITNLLQAITVLAFIPFQHQFMFTYIIVFLYSLLNQFYLPAEQAFVPEIVDDSQLARANGVFFLSKQAATLVGFAAAGFLFKFFSLDINLIICSLMLVIAFFAVLTLPDSKVVKSLNFEMEAGKFFNEVISGYKYIKNNKSVLYPILFLSLIQIAATVAIINVPVIVKGLFNIPVEDSAFLVITPVLIGSVIGVVVFPKILGTSIRKKKLVEYSLMSLSLCFLLCAFIPFLPYLLKIILVPVLFLFIGISFMASFIPSQVYLQQSAAKDMLGRVYGNIWLLVTLATILPLTLSASVAEIIGPSALVLMFSAGTLIARIYLPKLAKKLEFTC